MAVVIGANSFFAVPKVPNSVFFQLVKYPVAVASTIAFDPCIASTIGLAISSGFGTSSPSPPNILGFLILPINKDVSAIVLPKFAISVSNFCILSLSSLSKPSKNKTPPPLPTFKAFAIFQQL